MPSRVIRHFRYDPAHRRLTIVFQSGRCYAYHDVPQHVYTQMRNAFSRGTYFNENIRDYYAFTLLDPGDS